MISNTAANLPSMFSYADLESLCHRIGMTLQSGLAPVEVWTSESEMSRGQQRIVLDQIVQDLKAGNSLADALRQTNCFPALMIEMIRVGEETGDLDQVMIKLADHYRNLIRSRRVFYQGITWPLLQLIAAIAIVSLFLLAMSYLQSRVPVFVAFDLFGFGFSPMQNVVLLWSVLFGLGAGILATYWYAWRGPFGAWVRGVVSRFPLVGTTLERMAVSRFAWAFGAAIDAGIDASASVRLAIQGSNYGKFQSHQDEIIRSIERGNSFESSLRQCQAFPAELLHAIAVGERTGRVTESVQRLSDDYEEQSNYSLRRLGQISGLIVSLAVFCLIGFSVLSMYVGYMETVTDALHANTRTLAEIRSAAMARGDGSDSSDNSIIETRDRIVKDFVENNEGFQQIESIYTQLGRFGTVSNDEFLDGLLGETPAQKRAKEAQRRAQEMQQQENSR